MYENIPVKKIEQSGAAMKDGTMKTDQKQKIWFY